MLKRAWCCPSLFSFFIALRIFSISSLFHPILCMYCKILIRNSWFQDVAMEVKSYGGNGWAVFIMSAEGAVSNVTLHQPASPLETVIHKGCFDIVSMTGSYLPSKTDGVSSLKGGFAISLVGADGRIFGGGLAGPLIAASPVQVVIGRFAAGEKEETKQDVASGTPGATEPSDSPSGSSSDPGSPSN
uniref:AT-hook motif nuclear-localized protein n=1 Tax=Aegilops tauschii subsp. strangulata TaxID=200361 RepID=A0A453QVX4_AEGTS